MPTELITHNMKSPQPGPVLLITGGVHGDEFEPISAIHRLLHIFCPTDGSTPTVELKQGTLVLVPCVNEDAFRLGRRCASDNMDLARTCPGRTDGTVTEQTAWALSRLIREADCYIDLHTGGTEFALFPLSGYMLHADPEILDRQRTMAEAFNLPLIWGTSPHLEGRSLSVARDAGVPAIYCEYQGRGTCCDVGTAAYVDGCLNVMGRLKMIVRDPPSSVVQHRVEDHRHGSGHLQVCQPSPTDGCFHPVVALGDHVQQGHTIGQVTELSGLTSHAIKAEHTGIVIMLRTFPRVLRGESVGVVLECETGHRQTDRQTD